MQTEDSRIARRSFLKIVTASGVLAALGDLGFLTLKTEMAPDSAGVRSGLVSLSDRFESSSGIYSSR